MNADRTGRNSHSIALSLRLGVALALLLVAVLGAGMARADGILDTSPPPLTTLVKFNDRSYDLSYADTVSLEPLATSVVRKIGYGAVTTVNIATTSTGTYSSDGLVSNHVRYPGITVEERPRHYSSRGFGPSEPGFSIFSIGQSPNGGLVFNRVTDRGVRSCVTSGSIASCYRTY